MEWIHAKSYEGMCGKASQLLIQQIKEKPYSVLGMATGGTPEGIYCKLVQDHQENGTSYAEVKTFNLDEYVSLASNHPQSYHSYMNKHLFRYINLKPENTEIPNGKASDLQVECERYDTRLDQNKIDIQILGIGVNGHIGFNEPGTSFTSTTHVVELQESTRQANQRFFDSLDEVPTHAITMGIASIMKAKKIILLANGINKSKILHRLMNEEISEDLPASILKSHPNVVVIAEEQALSKLLTNSGS